MALAELIKRIAIAATLLLGAALVVFHSVQDWDPIGVFMGLVLMGSATLLAFNLD